MPPKYPFNECEFMKQRNINDETFNQFKQWCKNQKLPELSEQQKVLCLSCANSLEDAKNVIRAYFKCKSDSPELFTNMDIEATDLQHAITVYDIAVLPKRTVDNVVMAFGRLKDTSYSNFDLAQLLKLILMASEICLQDGPTDGVVVIIDMRGVGFLHLTKVRLGILQKFCRYVQEGMLFKLKAVHVLNAVRPIDKILLILKPFVRKEIFEAVHLHSHDKTEEVLKSFSNFYVPIDYGGSLPSLNVLTQRTYQKMKELQPLYAALEKQVQVYDELND